MQQINLKRAANKAPRRKQRGIKSAFQAAGFQPAFAPRSEELNPKEIKFIGDNKLTEIQCSF